MIPRHVTERVLAALDDTPVVYLQGARQTGKSTLAQAIAREHRPAEYLSLDSAAILAAAESDPEGFVSGIEGPAVIDEVQRVPALALAIKSAVDADRRPGRFLLTGSASVLSLPRLSDSLAGRVELHTLWPLSQGELLRRRETFIDRVLARRLVTPPADALAEKELLERIVAGGYPEAVARTKHERRAAWFDGYVTAILQRDVRDLASIERLSEVPRLLALLASRVGTLINYAAIARSLSLPQTTLKRYMALLEATFLVKPLPAWSTNVGKRLTKSAKLMLVDTGLLVHLLDVDSKRLRSNRTLLGHVLENYVAMELIKQLGWAKKRCRLSHFRTESGHEVDAVLEDPSGSVAGIEIKCTASVKKDDFKGLRTLAEIAGPRFVRGIVLYTGDSVVPFGKNLRALPIAQLWA